MNRRRLVLLVLMGVLAVFVVGVLFALAEPDSSYMRDLTTGETQVIYNSAADREKAEQLAIWASRAQGVVLVVVAGLAVHGTRPGKWLREASTQTTPPVEQGGEE